MKYMIFVILSISLFSFCVYSKGCSFKKVGDSDSSHITIYSNVLAQNRVSLNWIIINIKSGLIDCIGEECLSKYQNYLLLNCPDMIIGPGLINLHEHLAYNLSPIKNIKGLYKDRHDWLRGKWSESLKLKRNDKKVKRVVNELRQLISGTTSILDQGDSIGLLRDLKKINNSKIVLNTFPLEDNQDKRFKLNQCPKLENKKALSNSILVFHVGEGITKSARKELDCILNDKDFTKNQIIFVHGIAFQGEDLKILKDRNSGIIWSPRSNLSLYGKTLSVKQALINKIDIALGTDWLASGSMNLSREVSCAIKYNKNILNNKLGDKQMWEMVTINPAKLLGIQNKLGQIKVGAYADLLLVKRDLEVSPYMNLINSSSNNIEMVMKSGFIHFASKTIATNMKSMFSNKYSKQNCFDIKVCNYLKTVCFNDLNINLESIQKEIKQSYQLFFCEKKGPKNEPTCLTNSPK